MAWEAAALGELQRMEVILFSERSIVMVAVVEEPLAVDSIMAGQEDRAAVLHAVGQVARPSKQPPVLEILEAILEEVYPVEQLVVEGVAVLAARVLLQDPPTTRARLVVLDYRTLFLEQLLHMRLEALAVRVAVPLTERLVQRTEVMAGKAVMVTQLQTVETEGLA